MRPVERGGCPQTTEGKDLQFEAYGYARPFLVDRLGEFCSFCEMSVSSALAVEHIRHKDGNSDLECAWTNFLLACHSCNSNKGTKVNTQVDVDARLWPHLHRTFDVFVYGPEGIVKLAEIDDAEVAARAKATEEMVHLTRRPGFGLTSEQIRRGSDNRWKKRKEAWNAAMTAREDLRHCDTPEMRRTICAQAKATGFWSVWMTVFRDDPEMRRVFCAEAFPGTAMSRL